MAVVDHCQILHLVAAPTINRSDDGLISSAIGNTNNNHCSPCMTSTNILGHFIGIDTKIYVPGAALGVPNLMEVNTQGVQRIEEPNAYLQHVGIWRRMDGRKHL